MIKNDKNVCVFPSQKLGFTRATDVKFPPGTLTLFPFSDGTGNVLFSSMVICIITIKKGRGGSVLK